GRSGPAGGILVAASNSLRVINFIAAPRPAGPQPRDGLRRLQRRCSMFYELRRYDVAAGKLAALVDRFGSFTVQKWKQYGFRLIGFWTPVVADRSNHLAPTFASQN